MTTPYNTYKTEHPTPQLRFIEREGKRILQQLWKISTFHRVNDIPWGTEIEWRDVPLEVPTAPFPKP